MTQTKAERLAELQQMKEDSARVAEEYAALKAALKDSIKADENRKK
jgi:hypothetical protein